MKTWSIEDSKELYGVETWGDDYFDINEEGHVTAKPFGNGGVQLDLFKVTQELVQRGMRTPILIRLADVTRRRVRLLFKSFERAMKENGYKGNYQAVYPIKVNQQRHLVEDLLSSEAPLGLECGSKPELLVVLAMMKSPDGVIICNGFKDTEYIETALLSTKMGKHTIIVVDRKEELKMIIDAAKKLNVRPHIGFRVKLHSKGAGKWIDSSGDRSKFGLTSSEIVAGLKTLQDNGMLECLELLHFHIGSQIPDIGTIKTSLREGARFYTEVTKMGAQLKYLDVGGGLAVDYDGSGAGDSSLNYSVQEYANDVVSTIQGACEEANAPEPTIITENGRAMVAHHSILVFDILGANQYESAPLPQKNSTPDHKIIQELEYIYNNISKKNFNEFYHDVAHIKENALQLFMFGMLSLEQKALVDAMSWAILSKLAKIAAKDEDLEDEEIVLREVLSDTYFCNMSVFQSLPDSWALGQLFPVMPIHRLGEKPERRAVLVDLTCDSDGKISRFIDVETGEPKKTLEVHTFSEEEPYLMGAFLVGAYQETLGDLHNLFGDTDAVHISIAEDGQYYVDNFVEGDTTAEVLSYFQYQRDDLVQSIRHSCERAINAGKMTRRDAAHLIRNYESGLSGYTYLEDPDDEVKFQTFEANP